MLIEKLDFRTLCASTPIQIDFTPAGTTVPSAYLADNGAAYGSRNGYTYGWTTSNTANAFNHAPTSAYPVHSTGIYMKSASGTRYTWEMAVANGTYEVTIDAGDPTAIVNTTIKAEGTTVVSGTTTTANRYLSTTKTITVTDGKLTLTGASTTSRDPLMSLKIIAISSGSTSTTVPGAVTGQKLQAHGGNITYFNGTYYWYGENKDAKTTLQKTLNQPRVDVIGISCYSSTDLHTWTYRGLVLKGTSTGDLAPGNVLERPKVIYNKTTKQYVMWMHVDNATYSLARVAVATSSSPTGTFTYHGSFRPLGLDSRDMTIFQDDDGSAYLVFATDGNNSLRIAKMTSNYLGLTGQSVKPMTTSSKREAPELVKVNGYYFLLTSGATWFAPNAPQYAVSSSVLGNYTVMGSPAHTSGASTTYGYQGAYIFKNQATGAWYLLADKWNASNLGTSTYGFLPITFSGKTMTLSAPVSWSLTVK